jgi:hypothetical protein
VAAGERASARPEMLQSAALRTPMKRNFEDAGC